MKVVVALLGVLLAAASSAQTIGSAGMRSVDMTQVSRTLDEALDDDGSGDNYGCTGTGAMAVLQRPGRIYQIQKALRDAWIHHHGRNSTYVTLGVWALGPPGSSYVTAPYFMGDVFRIWAREDQTVRLAFNPRPDTMTWAYGEAPPYGDGRSSPNAHVNCKPGEISEDTDTAGEGDCEEKVPLCVSGSRDGKWAPDSGYCPGGTIVNTPFPKEGLFYVPTATHTANLPANFTYGSVPLFHEARFCDGTMPAGGANCGTGYPNFASMQAALDNLPTKSVGRYIINTYQQWPWSYKPFYYLGGYTKGTDTGTYSSLLVNLRNAAARRWKVAWFLQYLKQYVDTAEFLTEYQKRFYPLAVEVQTKPGWEAYYDQTLYPGDTPCTGAGSRHTWTGPANKNIPDDCNPNAAGPMNNTAYGPNEYQEAIAAFAEELSDQVGGADDYFKDVKMWGDEAPSFRGAAQKATPQRLRNLASYVGNRNHIILNTDLPSGWNACAVPNKAVVYGPISIGNPVTSTRLLARCEGPENTNGVWSVTSGCVGCEFTNPETGATGATGDPQAVLTTIPVGTNVLTFTCGTSAKTLTVVRAAP